MDRTGGAADQGGLPNFTNNHAQQHGHSHSITSGADPSAGPQPPSLHGPQLSRRSTNRSHVSEARSAASSALQRIKTDVLASYLQRIALEKQWTTLHAVNEGVLVKKGKGDYAQCPPEDTVNCSSLRNGVMAMNVKCAMTVNTDIIRLVLSMSTTLDYVQLSRGQRLQIIPTFDALPFCQRYQSAAFVRSHQVLVVWEDDPSKLIARAQSFQDSIVHAIVGSRPAGSTETSKEKGLGLDLYEVDLGTKGTEDGSDKVRRIPIFQTLYTTISMMLLLACMGGGYRKIAIEHIQDPHWPRFLLVLVFPASAWLSLFFFQAIVGNVAQIFGSAIVLNKNSKYYSANAPRLLNRDASAHLPHVTIQMPVYQEDLDATIKPTVQSVKQAISTYELQGGTASIFINDDGMQGCTAEQAIERQEFYDEHSIGWVARPKHNPNPKSGERAFNRRGRFKKASNMNYGMRLSCDVEAKLARVERNDDWTQADENTAYGAALKATLDERDGEAWAGGNIRIGDYILLIDSDTRVPEDCLLESVSEMDQSPEVAILQHVSGVMNVTNTFFERGITFFTNMIYTMIRFAVASGDVAPFVGHNAFLRWRALQQVSFTCEEDKWEKFWSESTVSEDFDMSLRLQAEGFVVRLAAYKGEEFKEGVSLTVYDELARWEKYAYGCNELIFHPLRDWPFRGPITPLFRRFICSSIPLPSKITIMAYIGTYYAIGSAWIFTTLNYFLIGFFNGFLDHYYLDSFRAYVAIVVVFTFAGNISLAIVRSRSQPKNIFSNVWNNVKWIPMFTIFLGGLSLHVSQAIACHFFGINMQWNFTSKEAVDVSFMQAFKHVARKFKWTFALSLAMTATMLVCAYALPQDWQIRLLTACWPMGSLVVTHALLPIVLNPELMRFSW